MVHLSIVWNGEGEVLPARGFEVIEDAVDSSKGGFHVRISFAVFGTHGSVSAKRTWLKGPLDFGPGRFFLWEKIHPGSREVLPVIIVKADQDQVAVDEGDR